MGREIIIQFGTEYTDNEYTPPKKHVVIQAVEPDRFESCTIIPTPNQTLSLGIPGTVEPKQILELTGRIWSLEEIIDALNKYSPFTSSPANTRFLMLLINNSSLPPQTYTID